MTILDIIYAYGHENVIGTHDTTIEITKNSNLTKRGNCIIAVRSSKACNDLTIELKNKIKKEKKFKIILKVNDLEDHFYGFGNKALRLLDKNDIVFRKSNFICDRTVLINCTKSSNEIDRFLLKKLKTPGTKLSITFEVENELNGK